MDDVVTFPFTLSADGFTVDDGGTGEIAMVWDPTSGSPPGSLRLRAPITPSATVTANPEWVWEGTWEDLGVPSGSIITEVRLTKALTYVAACSGTVGPTLKIGPILIRDSTGFDRGELWAGRTVNLPDPSWSDCGPQTPIAIDAGLPAIQPANATIRIVISNDLNSSNSIDFNIDEIGLTVTYEIDGTITVGKYVQLTWDVEDGNLCPGGISGIGLAISPCFSLGESNAVSAGLRMIWDVAPPAPGGITSCDKLIVCAESYLRWGGLQSAGRVFQAIWDVKQAIGNQRSLPWNVSFGWPVSADLSSTWDVAPAISGSTTALGWNVLTTISNELSSSWDVLTIVGNEEDLVWSSFNSIGREFETTWKQHGPISRELDCFWNVTITAAESLQANWDVRLSAESDLTTIWNISSNIGSDLSVFWESLRTMGWELGLRWKVVQSVSRTTDLQWETFLRGSADLNVRWYVHEQTVFTVRDDAIISTAFDHISDVLTRRGRSGGGFNSHRLIEAYGGKILEPTAFEPDARTCRDEYYVNAVDNKVRKRVYDRFEPEKGIIVAHWENISN